MKFIPKSGEVVYNKATTSDCLRLGLEISPPLGKIKPGQFIHLRLTEGFEPFLRRPFSIFNVIENRPDEPSLVEVLYQVVGKGTRLMARFKPGVRLSVLGPLGNGFQITRRVKYHIIVAGGIGIAALHLLLRRLIAAGKEEKVYLLYGAKTAGDLIPLGSLSGVHYQVATEDGSKGKKGVVTDLLKDLLSEIRPACRSVAAGRNPKSKIGIYACGPAGMTKAICKISRQYGIRTQVSLEQWMGCGVGLCRACVCPVKSENAPTLRSGRPESEHRDGFRYATVCSDGPVFEADKLYIS